MKFRVKFRLICGRGFKFNGANLDFVLNPRLKVRRAFGIKFAFVPVVLARNFTALWMKFYKVAAFYSLRGFCEQGILASRGQILSRRQNSEELCGTGTVKRQEILGWAERNFKTQRNDVARVQDRTASR
jgi:hypothetical protein